MLSSQKINYPEMVSISIGTELRPWPFDVPSEGLQRCGECFLCRPVCLKRSPQGKGQDGMFVVTDVA